MSHTIDILDNEVQIELSNSPDGDLHFSTDNEFLYITYFTYDDCAISPDLDLLDEEELARAPKQTIEGDSYFEAQVLSSDVDTLTAMINADATCLRPAAIYDYVTNPDADILTYADVVASNSDLQDVLARDFEENENEDVDPEPTAARSTYWTSIFEEAWHSRFCVTSTSRSEAYTSVEGVLAAELISDAWSNSDPDHHWVDVNFDGLPTLGAIRKDLEQGKTLTECYDAIQENRTKYLTSSLDTYEDYCEGNCYCLVQEKVALIDIKNTLDTDEFCLEAEEVESIGGYYGCLYDIEKDNKPFDVIGKNPNEVDIPDIDKWELPEDIKVTNPAQSDLFATNP